MRLLALPLLAIISVTTAQAATLTWSGSSDNRLSLAANYVEGIAPATGDEIVFPASASSSALVCDLDPLIVLSDVTFQPGSEFSFVDGGCRTERLTNGGNLNLGPRQWTVEERVITNGLVQALIVLGGPSVNISGAGFAILTIVNSDGRSIVQDATGFVGLTLHGQHLSSVVANAGEMSIGGGRVDDVIVAGGHFHAVEMAASSISATGVDSIIWGRDNPTTSLQITNGARYEILGCPNAFVTTEPPVLTGANLMLPTALNCLATSDRALISNTSAEPVVGEFAGFPEGVPFSSGARRYEITYHGGDGNDVQILAVSGVPFDFDADGRADISSFRPAEGNWYVLDHAAPPRQWGEASDKLVPGDYDGDGKSDHAVYRPSEGNWYITLSFLSAWERVRFGAAEDIPVPADFDGDGRADIAVFRPSLGRWWLRSSQSPSSFGVKSVQFGRAGDIPVPADYDGDGRADVAVFRPENATWYIRRSSGGDLIFPWGLTVQPHLPADRPVPADYDGDGKADVAVYRPWEGNWYIFLSSTQSPNIVNWGIASDQPVPADYDGDGRADVAIFRPSDGNWWINRSTAGVMVQQFGSSEDRPIPGVFVY